MKQQKWSKKKIIDEILQLHRSGEDLNAAHIMKIRPKLAHAAYKKGYFGSWKTAIRAAGLDYEPMKELGRSKTVSAGRKWTKEGIIKEILRLERSGTNLNHQYMREHHNPLLCAACKKCNFGSWKKAIEAAGLDYDKINKYSERTQWTKEKIIREIIELHKKGENLQYINIKTNYHALCSAGVREFGNWGNAVYATGIDYDKFRTRRKPFHWTKEKIVDKILELYEKGENLSDSNIRKKYHYLLVAATKPRLFNGWRNAVEAAGINYDEYLSRRPTGYWTKEKIIETIQDLHKGEVDLSLTNIKGKYGTLPTTASNKFGSWGNAIEAAGLDYNEINKYSGRERWNTERILRKIRELYESGENPSSAYCNKNHSTLFYAALDDPDLGSWPKAISKAGLNYDEIRKDIKTEFYKGNLLEVYLREIFKTIGMKVKYHERHVFNSEVCIPDFVNTKTGEWIDVKLNSWNRKIEKTAFKYLKYVDHLTIYYLSGPHRKWYKDIVVFNCIKDFYPQLKKQGREDIVKDLALLDKGIIPSQYQKQLEEYLTKENMT